MLLYTAGIYHPSIVSIQSIMRYHDTTLDTDSVFPLEQSTYICTMCSSDSMYYYNSHEYRFNNKHKN